MLQPAERPHINASDFLPRSKGRESSECGETYDCVDFETGETGPGLANDGPDDEGKPVEKVSEANERKESIYESATVRTSSNDDGGDGRWRGGCLRRGGTHEEQREGGEEDDAG